jgi:hypothetical protein
MPRPLAKKVAALEKAPAKSHPVDPSTAAQERKPAGGQGEMRMLSVRLPADMVKRIKLAAVERDQSVQDYVADVFTDHLS